MYALTAITNVNDSAILDNSKIRTECGINLDRHISVFQRLRKGHKFGVGISPVVVPLGVIRVSLDAFGVCLDSTRIITLLEQRISFFSRFSGLLWVYVSLTLVFGLDAFCFTKFRENIGSSVFGERLLEEFDSGGEVVLFRIC